MVRSRQRLAGCVSAVLERISAIDPQLNRARFTQLEKARATARAAWTAYAYGWRIMASGAATQGRTLEHPTSPSSGIRYATWQQPTLGGRLEVLLYQSDLTRALSAYSEDAEANLKMLCCNQYSTPSYVEMWQHLAMSAARIVPLEQKLNPSD